jgi:MOSC domain-containing protein YiiM
MEDEFTKNSRPAGRLAAINRSNGGARKSQVDKALITEFGVEGDRQADQVNHGGVDRAVTLYSLERIQALAEEGHPVQIGALGENLTVSGLDWSLIVPGSEILVGPVRLQITKFTTPCSNLKEMFTGGKNFSRISQKQNPGWSRACARVLAGGVVSVGDPVVLL